MLCITPSAWSSAPVTTSCSFTGLPAPQDKFALSVYEKLLMVGLIVGAVLLLHWLLLAYWRWRWPAGDKPLPELLVFPRMEIIVATVTVLTMAEVRHRCWLWVSS